MQVSVEATGALERRMTVEVPEERISGEVQTRLQRLARTAKVKGFRPGKVPMKVVAQQYGKQVRDEVVGEVIQSTYFEAISQEKLQPASMPTIESANSEEGQSLQYVAVFEIMPEVDLADISGAKLEKLVAEVSDADIDGMLENLRKQQVKWKEVKRAAADGDQVTTDFTGTMNGEAFGGNSGTDVPVTLGSGRMIDGFEAGLVGASAGEEKVLDLTFPEDYGNKELAGKPVQFTIQIKKVEEAELPELNEEFAKAFGIGDGSLASLRDEVKRNMQRELSQAIGGKNKQTVMDKLLEMNKLQVPAALVDNEAEQLKQQMLQQVQLPKGGKGADLDASLFRGEAERRVSLGLLIAAAIRSNKLEIDADTMKAKIEEIASTYEKPEEVVRWYYADKNRLSQIENLLLEDAVVDWAYANAKVTEKKSSFAEVVGQN